MNDVKVSPWLRSTLGPVAADPSILEVPHRTRATTGLSRLLRETALPLDDIEGADVGRIIDRIGDARVVLLGEATHGTSEFYRMRARVTRELISHRGFSFVAAEADWPDAARVDDYVLGIPRRSLVEFRPFSRFPQWMWRNEEVLTFVEWLRAHNAAQPRAKAGFHGLDLYSLFTSIAAVVGYLDEVDPVAARRARERYGALTPWQSDPAAYGQSVLVGASDSSEAAVVAMLRELLARRVELASRDGGRFFDAAQNARVVADAERYYRAMYHGTAVSWNLRDTHMFETLMSLLTFYGPGSKGIVWEHNSHVGDASATEMGAHGELNVGQLCRARFGDEAYSIGFGTDHGTVAAAAGWDEPMERMRVLPAMEGSYERGFHDAGVAAFTIPLRRSSRRSVREELTEPMLERAIGVVYKPSSERQSHYFYASLARQFDEVIWFDETTAIAPLGEDGGSLNGREMADTYPFVR